MKKMTLLLVPLLFVAACAGGTERDDAGHNDADVTFAQDMVPHHEQAVEMAALVPERTENTDVRDLATAITEQQAPEIETMQGWLDDWDAAAADGHHDMGDMSMGDGMMSDADMTQLEGLTGTAFDTAWLTMMTAHHEGAVSMAKAVIADGDDPGVKAFAEEVVDQQTNEIDLMTQLLADQS